MKLEQIEKNLTERREEIDVALHQRAINDLAALFRDFREMAWNAGYDADDVHELYMDYLNCVKVFATAKEKASKS